MAYSLTSTVSSSGRTVNGRRDSIIKWLALVGSLLTFAVTAALWVWFDSGSSEFQFVERVPWIPAFGIDYYVGLAYYQRAEFPKAQAAFQQLLTDYPTGPYAANGLLVTIDV